MWYSAYKYNIHTLINKYNFEYNWFYIDDYEFRNGAPEVNPYDFSQLNDPFLQEYKDNKIKLAEDILIKGTFTPFLYWEQNGIKVLLLGKHRLHYLLQANKKEKIKRKFLFIKLPYPPHVKIYKNYLFPILWFDFRSKTPERIQPYNYFQLVKLLVVSGDTLSRKLYNSNITPDKIFNNEIEFEKWLKIDIDMPIFNKKGENSNGNS